MPLEMQTGVEGMAHFQSGVENTLGHKFATRPLEMNTRTAPLRRRMEARQRSSGLEVTILRPPRLTNRGPRRWVGLR